MGVFVAVQILQLVLVLDDAVMAGDDDDIRETRGNSPISRWGISDSWQ